MKNKGTLDNSSINSLITQSLLSLEKTGVTKDDRLRFGLSLEEILLDYQGRFPKDSNVTAGFFKKPERLRSRSS